MTDPTTAIQRLNKDEYDELLADFKHSAGLNAGILPYMRS